MRNGGQTVTGLRRRISCLIAFVLTPIRFTAYPFTLLCEARCSVRLCVLVTMFSCHLFQIHAQLGSGQRQAAFPSLTLSSRTASGNLSSGGRRLPQQQQQQHQQYSHVPLSVSHGAGAGQAPAVACVAVGGRYSILVHQMWSARSSNRVRQTAYSLMMFFFSLVFLFVGIKVRGVGMTWNEQ